MINIDIPAYYARIVKPLKSRGTVEALLTDTAVIAKYGNDACRQLQAMWDKENVPVVAEVLAPAIKPVKWEGK